MATAAVQSPPTPPHLTPIQRPLKGSRISSFYPVKELPPLSALDSAFQLQEYISLLIRKDVHDVDAIVSLPGKGKEREGSEGEEGGRENGADAQKDRDTGGEGKSEVVVDESCWIYEQLRRLAQDLSHPLITMLQQECTRQTCPEMKAGEWLYLCVAHGTEGAMEQCCAIDYILHTLDSATALLNSPRAFPSRLSILAPSNRHFSSLARRLGRIFAHAYFHHRAAFAQAEAESALYARFLALTSRFNLVPAEFLVIPAGIVGYGQDDHDKEVDEYPRLLSASLDPRRERENVREDEPPVGRGGLIHLDANLQPLAGSANERRDPSPRKMGRNRTDTMVHSDVASVVEELGRVAAVGEGDEQWRERELTSERERVPTIRPGDNRMKAVETPEQSDKLEPEPESSTENSAETPQQSDAPVEMAESTVSQSAEQLEPEEVALIDMTEQAPELAASSEAQSEPAHAETVVDGALAAAPTEVDITFESPADSEPVEPEATDAAPSAVELEESASSAEIEHDVSEVLETTAEKATTDEKEAQEVAQVNVIQDADPNLPAEDVEDECVNIELATPPDAPHAEAEPVPMPEEAQETEASTGDGAETEEPVAETVPTLEGPVDLFKGVTEAEEEKPSAEATPTPEAEIVEDA